MEKIMTTMEKQKKKHTFDNIIEDIVELEILPRLPVKSLLRFMCVCRHRKSLISSHPFRKLHREKHSSSPPLIIASYNTYDYIQCNPDDFPIKEPSAIDNYLITFDLNGQIVEEITLPFHSHGFSMRSLPYQSKLLFFVGGDDDLMSFYLYNPSTRQTFELTKPSSFSSPNFDHRSSDLGYIPSKDEYIIVHLVKLNDKLYCEVLNNISISDENFDLKYCNQWRSIEVTTLLSSCIVMPQSGVFVGGAFYWEAITYENPNNGIILSFDVETECFSTFVYPQDLLSTRDTSLLQLKGELYLANYPESPPSLVLWKLSCEDKNKNMVWTRYWEFDLERLFGLSSGAMDDPGYFNWNIFVYSVKYLMGYDHQPRDQELSANMGVLLLEEDGSDDMPFWNVAVHTNLFTL